MTGADTQGAGRGGWIVRLIAILAMTLAGLAIVRPANSLAISLPGPSVFTTGLVDDPAFVASSRSVRSEWLARARQAGSTTVRIGVVWADVAPHNRRRGFDAPNPGDPNYNWSSIDAAVRTATTDGQMVLLVVNHAPVWAQAPHRPRYVKPGSWDPSASALAAFAHAIALRYSGTYPDPLQRGMDLPRVDYFQAWNEPNLPVYLMPQWVRGPHRSIVAESPVIYRALLNAFYAAVKAVRPQAVVLAAGTSPYGDPAGVDRMYPLVFLRDMFCLTSTLRALPCSDPPHLDVLDHHPYNLGLAPTVPASVPDDLAVPDLGKIWRVLRVAQRAHHVLPTGPKSLWVTEIDWSTSRPMPLTRAVQAAYLSEGFYELWRQDVTHVYWFQLRDPPGAKDSFAGGGLYSVDGAPKPAANAFRFPFVALPAPHRNTSVILWGKAPVAGTVQIQQRVGSGWRTVRTLTTTTGGIFYAVTRLNSKLEFRARIGASASLGWVNG